MAVVVSWDNEERTIVRADFSGKWTLEEGTAARREMLAMFDTVEHRVDVIWHWTDDESRKHAPLGIITVIAAMQREPHPRRGMIVSVPKRTDPLGRIWRDVVSKAFPRFRSRALGADTLEEAREMLRTKAYR